LALAGHDVDGLIAGARAARTDPDIAAAIATFLISAYGEGRNVVTLWSYAERLETVGEWFRQLWAESLGKRRADGTAVGQTPVHCVGSTDQHSIQQLMVEGPADKAVLVLCGPEDDSIVAPSGEAGAGAGHSLGAILTAMRRATSAEMVNAGCPLATIKLDGWDEASMGNLLMQFLLATLLGGRLLEVDPYGQPGVEAAKIATKELLAEPGGARSAGIADLLGEGAGIHSG
jgi:glucose-6-phosphate isomerase